MCRRPFVIRKDSIDASIVPCGKCDLCLKRRAAHWAFRLGVQNMHSATGVFATLTYHDDFLTECDAGYALNKHDLQCFFKRLRKMTKAPIKYYACGEYGGVNYRPHYHAIIFNVTHDLVIDAWKIREHRHDPGTSIGHVKLGPINDATIRYVTNYVCKSYGRKLSNSLPPEFSVMSKRLGAQYLTNACIRYHRDGMFYFLSDNGCKISLPRYYSERLFTADERKKMNDERLVLLAERENSAIKEVGIMEYLHTKRVDLVAAEKAAKRRFSERDYF